MYRKDLVKEIWKDIEGYEGYYQISNLGRVKSFHKSKVGVILKQSTGTFGYIFIELNLRGCAKKFLIHRLVAFSFLHNTQNKKEVNHIDGDKSNNHVSNLEWVTSSENQIHAFNTGLQKPRPGQEHHNCSITDDMVIEIRKLFDSGEYKQCVLATQFNLDPKHIHLIVRRKRWKHI